MGALVTWHSQEVVDGRDVVHGVRQHAHLLLPLLLEQIHVLLRQLALGLGSQRQRRVDHLQNTSGFLQRALHEPIHFHVFIQWAQQQTKQL